MSSDIVFVARVLYSRSVSILEFINIEGRSQRKSAPAIPVVPAIIKNEKCCSYETHLHAVIVSGDTDDNVSATRFDIVDL
jgi:hypothetical protein